MSSAQTKARILSVGSVLAVIGTGFLPADHWIANVEVLVHAWVWALMLLGFVGMFVEDLPPYNPWFAIPLTIAWIGALAFVGWTVLLGVYAVITLIATARRIV
jgi:hypothetical protein